MKINRILSFAFIVSFSAMTASLSEDLQKIKNFALELPTEEAIQNFLLENPKKQHDFAKAMLQHNYISSAQGSLFCRIFGAGGGFKELSSSPEIDTLYSNVCETIRQRFHEVEQELIRIKKP